MFGGYYDEYHSDITTTNSCLNFNINEKHLKEICEMNVERMQAACVVFQGNIVVTGGSNYDGDEFNTVELYDVFGDRWSEMPSMIYRHSHHSSVVVKSKLFIIGHGLFNTSEVFDNVLRKFVSLKQTICFSWNKCVSVGSKIVVFVENSSSIICYDVDKDEWSKSFCEVKNHLIDFSFVKIPQ